MYPAQIPRTPGVHLLGIADLSPEGARANLARVGREPARTSASSLADAAGHAHTGRVGVWITVEGETECVRNGFELYNAHTDPSGRYLTPYKRWHLIGLQVGLSVASVALRGEATGAAIGWNVDVVTTAKRDLRPGEMLDGEGGYTVWGKLLPAATSMHLGGLPLGLAHHVKLLRPVRQGKPLSWDDVAIDTGTDAYRLRLHMQAPFRPRASAHGLSEEPTSSGRRRTGIAASPRSRFRGASKALRGVVNSTA